MTKMMNEGERAALLNQVSIYTQALQKKLASLGLPVTVVLIRPDTGCVVTQSELIEMAEKK
jgi:hypothetical protein